MPENNRLSGCLDEINLEFVEREATPKLLMKLSIQLHLAGLSLSNTVSFLEVFGVDRVRSTVHNWVHKADLQPESGRSPNHVAVDEPVIRLDDDQYWLYAAVDPETNDLLHTQLEPTRNNALVDQFFAELREKHDVDDAIFLVDGHAEIICLILSINAIECNTNREFRHLWPTRPPAAESPETRRTGKTPRRSASTPPQ